MTTLYIVQNGPAHSWGTHYALIAEDGEYLYGHVCTNATFAQGDLHDRHQDRQEELRTKYGEYEVKWLGEDTLSEDDLHHRNQMWQAREEDA